MQNYSKIQKFISFLLIFSILFSFTINIKFFGFIGTIFASDTKYYNLVSIFVQEDIYSDIDNEVEQYAKNIQNTLENTKTIIIPTDSEEHPFNIASVNEKLYFEGEAGLFGNKGNSKLVGSVFIGDLALPVVENKGAFEKTVFPYVDFEDKVYIYNHETKKFSLNENNSDDPKAEIWHGFISPNTGDLDTDVVQIKDYFAKNNDYYKGEGNFKVAEGMTNGKLSDELSSEYEPYVFYYDQIRETKAVKYVDYKGYEGYLDNIEDITYNRFSAQLAEKLKEVYFGEQQKYIGDVSSIIGTGSEISASLLGPTTHNIPDIQNRHVIQNTSKKFLQIFNESTLGEFRKDVHNAGRYNSGSSVVNVDLIPTLITNLDTLAENSIKNVNNDLEKEINELVINGLSRKIPILDYVEDPETGIAGKNFYYGLEAANAKQASDCTIYRGSHTNNGQVIEANRGFNINNVQPDIKLCKNVKTSGYWGGNSPLNLRTDFINEWKWELKNSDVNKAIVPLYDINGGVARKNAAQPSVMDCFINNIIEDSDHRSCSKININHKFSVDFEYVYLNFDTIANRQCTETKLILDGKVEKSKEPLDCPTTTTTDSSGNVFTETQAPQRAIYSFKTVSGHMLHISPTSSELYKQTQYMISPNLPIDRDRFIDFVGPTGNNYAVYYPQIFRASGIADGLTLTGAENILKKYLDESSTHINSVISKVNGDVDAVWKDEADCPKPLGVPKMKYEVKYLNPTPWKTQIWQVEELNKIPTVHPIKRKKVEIYQKLKPDSLYAEKLTEYGEVKSIETPSGEGCGVIDKEPGSPIKAPQFIGDPHIWKYFMNPEVNLYEFLKTKPEKEVSILGETKKLNYVDTLVFSVYWNNLTSVSAKYAFIFENYLSDQFGGNDFNFYLPKSKRQYEISYMGAPGDAKNMYVKLDPEDKGENPYNDLIASNSNLNNFLFSTKATNQPSFGGNFKCAPPEGVPIREWIPAVMCRLKDMVPPKIGLTDASCGISLMSSKDDISDFSDSSDENKNGINDYLERELKNGSLDLKSDSTKYYYNTLGNLEASLLNASGSVISYDSISNIQFELVKLEIPQDENMPISEANKKVIFNKTNLESSSVNTQEAYEEALKYISFKNMKVRVQNGKAHYSFVSKSTDANVMFQVTLTLKDQKGNIVIQKENTKDIQIRGELFYATTYNLSNFLGEESLDSGGNGVHAFESNNIFLIEDTTFNSLKANLSSLRGLSSSEDKLFISLANKDKKGNILPVAYPLTVKLTDERGNIVDKQVITSLTSTYNLGAFKSSGTFDLEIKDKYGFLVKKEIEILPGVAMKIEPNLSTTLMEKDGVVTTHFFSIFDAYQNPTAGESYDVSMVLSGDSVVFDDDTTKKDINVFEGYKPFRLKSTSRSGKTSLALRLKKDGKLIHEAIVPLLVVDKIDFEVTGLPAEIKVGNNSYDYTIKVGNSHESVQFNSRAYLITDNAYISSNNAYIDMKNNVGTGSFSTKTKAGEKVNLEFKIEGVKNSLYKEINILPDVAIKVDLSLSKAKIEADTKALSYLYVDLKDRYGNVVWNDNTTNLNLEILEKYKHIIQSKDTTNTVKKGKSSFVLNGTNIPGTAFFKVSTDASLSNNSIQIIGQSPFEKTKLDAISGMREDGMLSTLGKVFFEEYDLENYRFKYLKKEALQKSDDFQSLSSSVQLALLSLFDENNALVINGEGENVGKIETFYFWNQSKIDGRKYNAIYTTLLGSNYGDITVPNNLSNALIFDSDNKSLAVTSLLNTLEKTPEVISLHPNGNIALVSNSSDLAQDISTHISTTGDGALQIEFYNNTFDSLVSTLFINQKNAALVDCSSSDIDLCVQEDKNMIGFKLLKSGYRVDINEKSNLGIKNQAGDKIFEITKDGKINKSENISFSLSQENTSGLVLDMKDQSTLIGSLIVKFASDAKINFVREISTLPSILESQSQGGIVSYLEGKDYYFTQKYLGNSTKSIAGYTISYNDPFSTDSHALNNFGDTFSLGYENFMSDNAIGWEEDNKTLLSFAAGKHVGDATKDYMSFSLINLGDPVVTLKPIKKKIPGTPQDRKFDSGIGYLISKDEDNIAYNIFDYNNDDITDIVILKRNGYIQLLEGTSDIQRFVDRGNLVYLADVSKKALIETGDFNGDGYDDIVVLNKNREAILLSNNKKDFTRIPLDLKLKGIISQMISYDMDLDGKHDLVTLDDAGEINVSYGTSTVGKFTKLKIDSLSGVELNNVARKDGGAIYYDGLYQIPLDKTQINIEESKRLLEQEKTGIKNEGNEFNEEMVDKLIFTQMNYGSLSVGENKENVLNNLPDLSTLNAGGLSVDNTAITEFMTQSSEDLNPGGTFYDSPNVNNTLTFLKSEYSEYEDIVIEKTYNDENGKPLQGTDKVKLTVKIVNESSNALNNFVFVDKIQNIFQLSQNPDYTLNIGGKEIAKEDILFKSSPSNEFSYMLDSYREDNRTKKIQLSPGESMYFTMYLDTHAFEYGYIEAGLFDTTTPHGDIVFKTKDENCGKPFELYKSLAVRSYEKEQKAGVCKNELPDGIKENAIDLDKNGVPDYIDQLVNGSLSGSTVQNYAKDKLNDFNKDSDRDGLTDREEVSPNYSNDEDFMNSLGNIDVNVDEILEGIDTILAGLSCGFGGGGCISAPLNRAPLAPGQDLSMFGMPVGDGLNIEEGLPIFSALTGMWYGPYCGPAVWPPSPLTTSGCSGLGAGGRLKGGNVSNFLRIFVTPTITGSVGLAVCLGGPANQVGQIPPKGVTPFVPGGNCIIAATPMFGCKNDGSDGEMPKMGLPGQTVLNGNCSGDENTGATPPYLGDIANEYLSYKKTGTKPTSLKEGLKDAFSKVANRGQRWELPSQPLLNVAGSADGDLQVDVDFSALKSGNFSDVLNINMTRISPFPDYVMEWVTRQIEEIANKLTDFPTLYVILPDFDGVFDNGFGDFIENLKKSYDNGEKNADIEQSKIQSQIESSKAQKSTMDCGKNQIGCLTQDLETKKFEAKQGIGSNKTVGGVKAAYEFMSNMPIISIQTQKVNFNLPWIDKKTVDRAIANFQLTKKQREQELARAKSEWKLDNYNCVGTQANSGACKISADAQSLIYSIDKNIEIFNEYKRLPEKVHKMLKIKEIRISQILCNLETISKITGGRIGDNGKRFKAWVELYILIKAILKSWQLLVDVFVDYSAECHQCKNERYDLLYYVWKLISAAMPKIPIIKFPKWPDIYLDLHNIRVNLVIGLPEFEFNLRPIVIPPLPALYLPNSPTAGLKLPALPLLPQITLGELPDLPALPKIELPNLPPPPKLPKLLSSIEAFLNILKIITKVMCILKTSPFVPETRAGDQIAFITERSGYLSLDFLDISLPQFSFPFVDAIKVTTYVNLEFEVEFLVEMARQTALPLNVFTNNIANMLNIGVGDLDFRNALPVNDIEVKLDGDTGIQKPQDIHIDPMKSGSYQFDPNAKISLYSLAKVLARNILKIHAAIEKDGKIEVSNETFKELIASQLKNIKNEKIVGTWEQALNYSFTKEDELIQKLIDNNDAKFNEVKTILNEEKTKTNKIMSQLQEKLEAGPNFNTLISTTTTVKNDYNTRLEKYKLSAQKSIQNLFIEDSETKEIRQESQKVLEEIQTGLGDFSQKLGASQKAFENVKVNNPATQKTLAMLPELAQEKKQLAFEPQKILANTTPPNEVSTKTSVPPNEMSSKTSDSGTCGTAIGGYSYIYKGIYIIEEFLSEKISYLLFDYTDELSGKEVFKESDFDNDGDDDIIYMVGNQIFIKENLKEKKMDKEYYSGSPLYIDRDDNKFYTQNAIEAVNGLRESISDNSHINVSFLNATNPKIANYNIEFYHIVDKYSDVANGLLTSYIPQKVKKYIIDAFRDIDDITRDSEITANNSLLLRKNLAYINTVGNLAGVKFTTKELLNLKNDIAKNLEVTINAGTKVYADSDSVKLTYYLYSERNNELKFKDIVVQGYHHVEFTQDVILVGLNGDAYVEGKNTLDLSGNAIIQYVKKPLLPGSKFEYQENEISQTLGSYVGIKYYDGSERDIDFSEAKYYELYDLGANAESYLVRTSIENNFYYAKIRSFKNNIFSTYSNQILLSPQKESDNKAPQIDNFSALKIPVYQKKIIDMSEYIFEDSGTKNITEIYVDFDGEKDTDNNGNLYDDKDFEMGKTGSGFDISIEGKKILFAMGPFDKLYNKKIRLSLVDSNGNTGYKDVSFIVYSPIPKIETIDKTIGGRLNEPLLNEPVNFYKLRGGSIQKLSDKNDKDTTNTFDGGKFHFEVGQKSTTGLVLSSSGENLFKVNEQTGKIELSDFDKAKFGITYSVYSSNNKANDKGYPKIVVSKGDREMYYQYLVLPNTGKVEIVSDFSGIKEQGIYYKHNSNLFSYYQIPLGVTQNPGDVFVYSAADINKERLFTLFKDGRINTQNELYYLEYDSYDTYVVYNLRKVGIDDIIGKVMIIPEKNYILR